MIKILILLVVAHIAGVALNPIYKARYPKVYGIIEKIVQKVF